VLDGRLGAAAVGETVSNVGICRTFSRRAPSLCASDAHVMHNAATLLTIDPRGNRWQTHGDRFGLFQRCSRTADLPLIATGCAL
jgi:hypothetical protein